MIYKDIALSFQAHPDTGDVFVRTGRNAVAQSITNLVNTNAYDRPFQPLLNSNIRSALFNPISDTVASELSSLVTQTIKNYESRVKDVYADIKADDINSRYIGFISYTIVSTGEKINQQILLERVR